MSDRRSITRVTLRAIPLTPVHVGDGQSIRLDEYLIEAPPVRPAWADDETDEPAPTPAGPAMLCRFDQGVALRAMSADRRATFRRYLDEGQLGEASKLLRAAGRGAVIERIVLSEESRRELQEAMDHPAARTGQVNMFIRSGGRPFIPGSSIKGAFRTALASARLPAEVPPRRLPHGQPGSSVQRELEAEIPLEPITHDEALRHALGVEPGDTASDPLRFLSVSDAALPEGSTRIDRAVILKRNGACNEMQMHYERLCARSDGATQNTEFAMTITVDGRAKDARCVPCEHARFDVRDLLRAVREFHVNALNAELRHFFPGSDDRTRKAMMAALTGALSRDGRPPFTSQGFQSDCVVLRLGRFGHFESKSLARVRQGHFPQAKNPAERTRKPDEWGMTRTVIRNRDDTPIPFGWVLAWVEKEETL